MFQFLAPLLSDIWGPFRLLGSYTVLMAFGAGTCALSTWILLPRLWNSLPVDRGRAYAVNADKSLDKPTGGGLLIVLLMLPWLFLVLPFHPMFWGVVGCLFICMLTGYLDDRSQKPWGEFKKGSLDLAIAVLTSLILCQGQTTTIWLPFVKGSFELTPLLFIPLSTMVLWISINATNCSDGVDGLAGLLTLLSLFYLAGFMYIVVGNEIIADYLLVPHSVLGADWAVLLLAGAGTLAGYIWHNAPPSAILMGDAGSRFLGLFVGIAVVATGNPFLILVMAPMVLANGGTGLVKIAVLRLLGWCGFEVVEPQKSEHITGGSAGETAHQSRNGNGAQLVKIIHSVRFPLHDHCRHRLGWSDSQVLVRFLLLQTFITPLLLVLFVKVR
ncbi:MAG: hypothetical protein ACOCZS_04040, partial [Verrucomicrobiota bacterium]